MARHVALLRAINLGARRKVPMARLREVLEEAGYTEVATYVQSGNVVLSSRRQPGSVERDLHRRLSAEFGFDIPVIVRSREQLAALVEREGPAADQEPSRFLVTFRADGTEVCAYFEDGAQGQAGDPEGTARNWRTVLKLLELA
jgi:uncharacterized protein (DUF1697 family)